MTKLRGLAPALLLACIPAAVLADDYRLEIEGAFSRDMPSEDGPFGDIDNAQLSGTWYFAPVSTDNVPLAEAAYLGRASFVSAVVAQVDFDGFVDTRLNGQGVNVGYYIPNTMFYASVGVSHGQNITALNGTIVEKDYNTTMFGTLGIAPLDGLLVTTDFVEGGYTPNLAARYVGKLPNSHFYAGKVSIVDPDEGDLAFGVDFDYYFDASTSLGIGYGSPGDRLELRAEKFFSKSWAAGISAYTAGGVDGFGISVKWRH